MASFELLEISNSTIWEKLILNFPERNKDIYYSKGYCGLFELNNEGKVLCFVVKQNNLLSLYPFLINNLNDLGYNLSDTFFDLQGVYGYNGVISNSYDLDFINLFYIEFNKYCSENNIISEFTRFHPVLGNHEFSKNHLNIVFDRETVVLDLTKPYEEIWEKEYSSKNRNVIRKARNAGFRMKFIENPGEKEIDQFYEIYHFSMVHANAENYYFFNRDFFYNTFKYLKDFAFLINVENESGKVVCSSIFFHYGDFFHYHLSGRTAEADNSANNFLLDETIKFAQRKGAHIFHFGGGRSNDPQDSLLRFKSNFSKARLPFFIGKKIHNQDVYNEVVRQWEEKFPEKKEKYKNHLLKYRY